MNLVADESVDCQIVNRLRDDGHKVLYIAEVEPSISDDAVFNRANEKAALLITADKDFGEIVFRDKRLISDVVVLLRLAGLTPAKKADVVSESIRENELSFPHHFSVISPGKVRIRSK
jgi:predicted nuclease of predicted toxin-antitoxin system